VQLTVAGRVLRFSHAEAPLTSLALSAVLPLDGGAVLFGTEGGELLHLSCPGSAGRCTARTVGFFPSHPVTGLVKQPDGAVLVGVLGEGLHELRGEKLERSKLDVGSVYVTGVAFDGRDVVVGTAYNGLWRVAAGRAVRTRFPHSHVQSLTPTASGVEVASGAGRYLQKGRDKYVALAPLTLPTGSAAMMAAARFEGEVYLGGFDSGLWRWADGKAQPVPLGLGVREEQVNALAEYGGALWVGTEAGLLRVSRGEAGPRAERIHEASVHDLAVGAEGLAVATSRGLLVVSEGARVRRVDLQSGVEAGKFFAVAWQGRTLWAGGMDGLYRFEEGRGEQLSAARGYRGGWVTALLTRGDSVWVGTYSSGVYAVREGRASQVPGLEGQWVPLRALKAVGDEVWVGGLGMASVRVSAQGGKRAVHLPTRDVNDVLAVKGGTLLLTTDGALLLPGPTLPEALGAPSPAMVYGAAAHSWWRWR
jgi:ligand-binding sensor domain-containing protein